MLPYKEFKEEIRTYLEQEFGDGHDVDISRFRKANTGIQDSITIFEKGNREKHISPQIYLKPLYLKYKEGMTMQEIKESAVSQYREGLKGAEFFMESMPDIGSYEKCMGRLYFRLVGTERNRMLLKKVPHREVMDLSFVPYILIGESEKETCSAMVNNTMVKKWGIPEEAVLKQAFDNMPKIMPARADTMKSMAEAILEVAANNRDGGDTTDILEAAREMAAISGMLSDTGKFPGPFVLTNKKGINGFAAVFYPGVLKDIADIFGKNLFVLPSSIHESLLVADDGSVSAAELRRMVREVNAGCVAEEEIVSDSVYFYDRKEGKLSMAKEEELCAGF